MSKQAYRAVLEELKDRIKGVSSRRLRRPSEDPTNGGEHEEPDGDEDEEGNEPPGPEEDSVPTPCPHCGR